MTSTNYQDVQDCLANYTHIPVAIRSAWPDTIDPFEILKALSTELTGSVILESGRAGRYTYLAYHPSAIISSKNRQTTIIQDTQRNSNQQERIDNENPLHVLRNYMGQFRTPRIEGLPDYTGGAIGYLSYDLNQIFEPAAANDAVDDLQLPDLYVMMFHNVIAFDHETREIICIRHVSAGGLTSEVYEQTLQELRTLLQSISQMHSSADVIDWEELRRHPLTLEQPAAVSFAKKEFEQAVERVQQYIAQGDVFQVNLSVRQTKPISVEPQTVYSVLRRLNPSPYMGYMHLPDFQLVSASPELLVKVKNREVSTRPIAGTRPRGKNEAEDFALAQELINNEKERAEHVMLVDLERNDLGRVCRYGSVDVSEFMVIEKYSHVMHIVSHVKGELADDKDAYDAVEAAFPGGTITGAPKIRTMQIIGELEPVKRGVYTGSIGWFDFNGDVELNIAIRTMVVKDQQAHVQAGAGIVIDSNPEAEYLESLKKAEALWKALELSQNRELSLEESRV
ncbi:anthranilate synthase component I family protein [Brevibacillus ginsengisoli]|uniref:anthranilate synthase component I family protein n=1 Tax=Brevibacillus ginsengisoli TaxID=363854 RepID=UPI003CF8E39E